MNAVTWHTRDIGMVCGIFDLNVIFLETVIVEIAHKAEFIQDSLFLSCCSSFHCQSASLGDHKIRDLNDTINRLLLQKWK
jgi:hypothetical protein